jgi:thiamine pyrophosphate-dependent acetolactate synthase large subunit-like protein
MASHTAAEALVSVLEQLDVGLAFGLPGVHNLPIWKALSHSSIRLVGVRHEQAAVYAADGYARATGRLGVALVTSGPGAANALGATGEAMASSSPVLVIATDIPSALRRPGIYRGVLHETRDQARMFEPVTKLAVTVQSAPELPAAAACAGRLALSPNSGPVYLGVPTDLLSHHVGLEWNMNAEIPAPPTVDDADLAEARRLLTEARCPLIWAGGGALRAGVGSALGDLAIALDAPVLTTYMGRGLLPPEHPMLAPGPAHTPEIGALWDEADVVLAVGSDFDGMMTQNWLMPQPPTLIAINVDSHDASKNYRCDLILEGDAATVLPALCRVVGGAGRRASTEARLAKIGGRVTAAVEADEPQAAQMLAVLDRTLSADTVVVADMCIPGYWIAGFRRVHQPRTLAYPVGWGTLGFAFPASIGVALAGQGPAVCVTGDGGFLFATGELATIAQEQIPVTVILVDDGGYGMLRFDQVHAGDEPFGVDLSRPDFVRLVGAFGLEAKIFDSFGGSFEAALQEAVRATAPRFLIVNASLKPPPTTSPRWYRRADSVR